MCVSALTVIFSSRICSASLAGNWTDSCRLVLVILHWYAEPKPQDIPCRFECWYLSDLQQSVLPGDANPQILRPRAGGFDD